MKLKFFLYIFSVCLFFSACKEPEPPIVEENGYEAPDAPTTINLTNLVTVEFFSKLTDETLFNSTDYQAVESHILAATSPLAFFFDRSDVSIGSKSPVVEIALGSKLKSFFIQNNITDTQIEGTGMIVKPLVPNFEGCGIPDSLYLAGCTLAAPLSQPTVLTLMTCKLNAYPQFPLLVSQLGDGLKTNKLVFGTIAKDISDSLKNYLKFNLQDFRLAFTSSEDTNTKYSIFYLTPVEFVHRETTEWTISGLPMYQCKIEYLN